MKLRQAACLALCISALSGCAGGPAPVATPTTQAEYDHDVLAVVARSTKEPAALSGSGAVGIVHVSIILDPTGQLVSADIAQSSGTPGLDNFALAAIENAQYPHLPAGVPQQDQGFDVPIDYNPPRGG